MNNYTASSQDLSTHGVLYQDGKLVRPEVLMGLDGQQITTLIRTVPGGAENIQDIYPLSPLQEGMLFHYLLNERGDTYILSTLLKCESHVRVDTLRDALQKVIDRHDILRSALIWEQVPTPLQVTYRRAKLWVEEFTLDVHRDVVEQLRERMRPGREGLDLRYAPLVRLQVAVDTHDAHWYALLRVHHIICDYQSLKAVVAEMMAFLEGREYILPAPVPYRRHVEQVLAYSQAKNGEEFFRRKLGQVDEPTAPFEVLDVHGDGSRVQEVRQVLEPALAQQIRTQAQRSEVSVARLFHAAWALVVARTSGRDDVVYGTVLSVGGQRSVRAERMMGLSVNTLPLRLQLRDVSVKGLVEITDQGLSELLNYGHFPLPLAQRCSGIRGGAPLFTTLFNYRHNIPDQSSGSENIRVVDTGEAWTSYPITILVDDLTDGFALIAETDQRIDPGRIIGYLQTAMRSLVEALEQAPQTPALSLSISPESERQQVLELFNATQAAYPQEKLVHELFEEQVYRTPGAVAVICEGHSLTYAELNAKANQLAHYLRERQIGPDQLVGICVERSLSMVVGLLGILKAGAAYVPLDPSYPPERLRYMLSDAAPKVILTQKHLRAQLPYTGAEAIALDDDWRRIAVQPSTELKDSVLNLCARHLAYVIYTSGSTGQPKGAMNEHRGVVNRLQWMQDQYRLGPADRVLQKTPLSFDVSVWEFFWTLMSGAQLILARPEGHKDPNYLTKLIEETGVTTLHFVPSMLQSFLAQHRKGNCPSLRHIVCSGEELSAALQRKCFECLPQVRLSNLYGPTEAAVDVTAWECRRDDQGDRVPIGRPIANARMYVLNGHGQPAPIGVTGDLYIGGICVGRGYLNQPKLTDERFIKDPFSEDSFGRMYKTGDLARWRPDGNLEYLGRSDYQVKIRGFRIELGEVEARLAQCEGVKEAAVIAREDSPGDKRLVAYVVGTESVAVDATSNVEQLRAHLKALLPDYMVPSAFVALQSFPLSPNGKLDRRALPAPELGAYVSRGYEAPQGEIEESLVGIWQFLLRVERVGRRDNFFELGGNSLLIVQMMEKLRRLGLSAEVRRVFESNSLAELASILTRGTSIQFEVPPSRIPIDCEAISPAMLPLVALEDSHIESIVGRVPGGVANIQDIYPLAPLQEGILFHHLLDVQGGDTYVLTTLLSVSSRERVEEFIAALQAVIDRHDILRSAILWEQLPQPVQVVYRQTTLTVEEIALERGRDSLEQIKEWLEPDRQRLDLRRAPLMRMQMAADPHTESWYILLQLHHIICDHVTADVVVSEAVAYLQGRGENLSKPVAYRDHVAQALAYAQTQDIEAFFRSKFGDVDEPTAPFGLVDVYADGSRIDEARLQLEPALAQRTRTQARRMGVSVATLFHAAWGLVVASTTGRDDVVFGSVLLGRLQGASDSKRVGLFVNTLPLRLRLGEMTARTLVEQTQRGLIELLDFEQASLVKAQRCSAIGGSAPLFSSLLNYRHSMPNPEAQWESAQGLRLITIQDRTNYPITLSVDDLGEGLSLSAQTDRRIDPRRVIGYLQTAVHSLVDALEQASQTPALRLSVLPESEQHQVVCLFNCTEAVHPQRGLVHEWFEEQVARTPEAVAVLYEGESLTYAQLNRRANQLAQYLRERAIEPDQLVGICIERSFEMVVGILGILKAGGAYVPLDPNYPTERLAYILRDAEPKVLLTQHRLREMLPDTSATVIALDSDWEQIVQRTSENLHSKARELHPHNLAYVIYTSGSTGNPKGVMVEHRNVTRLFAATERWFRPNESDVWTLFHSFAFDFSVWELWGALLYGGRVVVISHEIARSPREFYHLLCKEQVTVLNQTPSAFVPLIDAQAESTEKHSLRVVIFGGEALELRMLRPWVARNVADKPQLVNMYGITETTVHVTYRLLTEAEIESEQSNVIGKPIPDLRAYLLNSQRQPVPIGVAGEIYVGGAGVSRGYLNRPELTAERFIADPFSADPQARLYKTGDLGRWRADGSLEYVGRNDNQVKIRGFRIELGEIEAQLRQHPLVKQAIVLAREDEPGEKRLVAYVVGNRNASRKVASDAPEKLRNEIVGEWETLYEDTYRTQNSVNGPSFIGWNSSYTNAPIPEPQMQEWLDGTIARIQLLQPKKVLEIGCGVGLLLQHLAPLCSMYIGTDFSPAALAQVRQWTSRRKDLLHVQLLRRSAMELQDLPAGSFDLVILNSVVQYFPDIDYLVAVLQEAVRLLCPGGKIFVGDIRHLDLLPMFHSAVQLSKAAATVTVGQLKNRVARATAQEKELVIRPQFFQDLPGHLPGIRAAEVQLKEGRAANELMRYRYDVVLQTGEQVDNALLCEPLEWSAIRSIAELHTALKERRWRAVRLTSIPNARLAREAAGQRLIETSDERLEVGALRHQLNESQINGIEPDMFWPCGDKYGYNIQVTWGTSDSPECFEVQLVDRTQADQVPQMTSPPAAAKPWATYANDPMDNAFRQQLVPELRKYLKERLPEHMLPTALITLKELPLTPNGKVDRRALPTPQSRPEELGEYIPPRTPLEQALANIWASVLRVDRVGVHDNFFELGGHSLLATTVTTHISHLLNVDVPIRVLFEKPTVQALNDFVVQEIASDVEAS